MKTDYNLLFLKNKIAKTGTALCNFHLAGWSDTSYIIHINSIDENGKISFSIFDSLPSTNVDDLQSFGLRLFFFKKGLGYHINIEAIASAIETNTPEDAVLSGTKEKKVLEVRAKILSAEYVEGGEKKTHPGFMYSVRKKLAQMAASILWL